MSHSFPESIATGSPRPTSPRMLLVEGVPGIGKSTTLDRMLRYYAQSEAEGKIRTVVMLAQTHTYGPLVGREDSGTLTKHDCLDHLNDIVSWLEWIAENSRAQNRPKSFALIDTLHLTQCLRPGVIGWDEATSVDHRLAAIGCKLLLLDAADETVRRRTVHNRAETEFIQTYALGRFGDNHEELERHFLQERDSFRAMYQRSSMQKLQLPSEEPIERTASQAFRFLTA